jgi:hypothetical protein
MRILILRGSLLSVLALGWPAYATDKPFTDAASYCQAVGTADRARRALLDLPCRIG